MSIEKLVRFASAALLGLVAVSAIVFATAINTIRIGGGHELNIELSAELEADILPPPLFIVEPYAVAMEGFLHDRTARHAPGALSGGRLNGLEGRRREA